MPNRSRTEIRATWRRLRRRSAAGGARRCKTRDERLAWWREARFGCFIHWGVYSGPAGEWNGKNAGGYAEHLMRHCQDSAGRIQGEGRLGL